MLKKLVLCRKINKFYKIFGEYISCSNFYYRMRGLTDDNLMSVGFDIAEAINWMRRMDDPMTQWLNKLYVEVVR